MMLGTRLRMDTPNSEQPSFLMGANLLEKADLNRTHLGKEQQPGLAKSIAVKAATSTLLSQ
jgi:hypothetical protein